MQNDIRAVIWDLGGVILRTEDPLPRYKLAEKLGVPLQELYAFIFTSQTAQQAEVGELPAQAHWEAVRYKYHLDPYQVEEFKHDFWAGDQIDYELVMFIKNLRPKYRTALLSNAWSDARQLIGDKFGIFDAFDDCIISAEVGMAKPDPRIYLLTLNRLGIEAGQSIFIDDVEKNVNSAQKIGMLGIQFKTRDQVLSELHHLLFENT